MTGTLFGGRLYAGMLWDGALWAWGNAWGGWTAEVDEVLVYHGGGGKVADNVVRYGGDELREDVVRQQWELLELRLRNKRDSDNGLAPQDVESLNGDEDAGLSASNVTVTMPVLAAAARKHADFTKTNDDASSAEIDARKRRNQVALLMIMSQL